MAKHRSLVACNIQVKQDKTVGAPIDVVGLSHIDSLHHSIVMLVIAISLFLSGGPALADKHSCQSLSTWTNKYPVEGNENLVRIPIISYDIQILIGDKYYNRLFRLEKNPYYLTVPIRKISGYLVLDFLPNPHLANEDTRVVLFIKISDCEMHAAFLHDDGRVRWRHSDGTVLPSSILKEYNLTPPQ